jgi:TonB-linked SusC/RagA family outer membrane protein
MKKNELMWACYNSTLKKVYLRMRMIAILLLIGAAQLWAVNTYSQDQKVTISKKGASIVQVLEEIESNTGYTFVYNSSYVNLEKEVSLDVEGKKIEEVLDQLFVNSDVVYKIIDEMVVLMPKVNRQETLDQRAILQATHKVEGTVMDAYGDPVPGANVYVKSNPGEGVITGIDGSYSIQMGNANGVLVFSFIGFEDQEINVGGRSEINITLVEEEIGLNEVVVVGYTTQKKSNISGAISTVSLEKVENRTITHLSQALAGTTSGINVTQGSGFPGNDGATIYVRGLTTINGTNPLVVIDGVVGDMRDVSNDDVASISVLKDAASSAIYGARAANGVILITTKKGKVGGIKATYDYSYGVQDAPMLGDFVSNSADYMTMVNTSLINGGDTEYYPEDIINEYRNGTDPVLHANTDWIDYVMGGTGSIQKHNLSLSGGSEASRFRMSLGYLDQSGIQPNTSTELFSMRTNLEMNVSDRIDVGMNLYGSWRNNDSPGGSTVGLYYAGLSSPMVVPVHPEDGRFGGVQTDYDTMHRNAAMIFDRQKREQEIQRLNGDIHGSIKIVNGLTLNGRAALNFSNSKTKDYTLPYTLWNFRADAIDFEDKNWTLTDNNNRYYSITLLSTLNYTATIAEVHNISALAGAERFEDRSDWIQGQVGGFVTEKLTVLNAGRDPETHVATGSGSEDALMSYFGNLTYNFDEKYFFTGNVRYDASAKFHPDYRWGVFPAFSGAWRISKENFMSNVSVLSNLQLRAGWGQVGNNTIGRYKYFSTYDFEDGYVLGGKVQPAAAVTAMVNETALWETVEGVDIGLDIGLFNNSLTISAGVFDKLTKDILLTTSIPKVAGDLTPPTRNLGEMSNKGFEVDIDYRGKINDLRYKVKFNLSHVKNEVLTYSDVPALGKNIVMEGQPLYALYGYETAGIFQTQEEIDNAPWQNDLTGPGDLRFVDQLTVDTDDDGIPDEADGIITPDDRVVLGNPFPKFTYGFNLSLEWKGIDFTSIVSGKYGSKGYLQGAANYGSQYNGARGLLPAKYLNTWSSDNMGSTIPRLNDNGLNQGDFDYYIYDTSYLKIQTVQIGYTLPSFITDKAGIGHVRVYANGENLFTFADFEGFDPERNLTNNGMLSAPLLRTYTFGINVNF